MFRESISDYGECLVRLESKVTIAPMFYDVSETFCQIVKEHRNMCENGNWIVSKRIHNFEFSLLLNTSGFWISTNM